MRNGDKCVEIIFSRHARARRRGKLYRITSETVRKILKGKKLIQGKQEFIENIPGLQYPLKVIGLLAPFHLSTGMASCGKIEMQKHRPRERNEGPSISKDFEGK